MRLYQVRPGLLISAHPTERDVPKLVEHEIDAIVCLSRKPTPLVVQRQVPVFLYRPIPDGQHVNHEQVTTIAQEVCRMLSRGNRVLLHCLAGRNRSGLIAALVQVLGRGISGREALELVREVRPTALYNPVFITYLEGLA